MLHPQLRDQEKFKKAASELKHTMFFSVCLTVLLASITWSGVGGTRGFVRRQDKPVVQTTYGQVQGVTKHIFNTSTLVDVFRGIPHARPPIGLYTIIRSLL